jgi:hypothetical protein
MTHWERRRSRPPADGALNARELGALLDKQLTQVNSRAKEVGEAGGPIAHPRRGRAQRAQFLRQTRAIPTYARSAIRWRASAPRAAISGLPRCYWARSGPGAPHSTRLRQARRGMHHPGARVAGAGPGRHLRPAQGDLARPPQCPERRCPLCGSNAASRLALLSRLAAAWSAFP